MCEKFKHLVKSVSGVLPIINEKPEGQVKPTKKRKRLNKSRWQADGGYQ